ncbi:hypothetical protein EYF80_042585 [Liparis tanakae]|uniref:Uncharacterized protein n=1 Tax=Liparis tanakae TaxID=230148 RepID=A0A4Z2G159_9TELE|nr:hypothetical protein EYF80_042585 [Liparis tanakae]
MKAADSEAPPTFCMRSMMLSNAASLSPASSTSKPLQISPMIRVEHFLGEEVLHDGLHDGEDVSVIASSSSSSSSSSSFAAALLQSQALQGLDEVVSS